MLILLPLTGVYMDQEIVEYCAGIDFSMLSMDFLPTSRAGEWGGLDKVFDREQDDEYLGEIGVESKCGVVNVMPSLVFLGQVTLTFLG